MQKKIIALAVAGLMSGAAFAQSTVTISGLMRMSAENTKITGNTASTTTGYNRYAVTDNSSIIMFTGKEDLGGGMYAGFVLDSRPGPDNGAPGWVGGNSNVHLGGSWGRVAMGRQDLHYGSLGIESYKAYSLQNHLQNGLFSQVSGNAIANATRTPNVLMYDSPNMSGFSARVALSANFRGGEGTGARAAGAVDPAQGKATNLALNYANGPIKAGYSYWRATTEGGKAATVATSDQRGDTVSFGYTFPMGLAIGLGWNKSRLDQTGGTSSRKAWLLPIRYSMGNNEFAFTYATAGDTTAGAAGLATGANTGAKAYTLAYSYSMSKRTNVGISYTKLDNKSAATYDLFGLGASGAVSTAVQGAGSDPSQMAINVVHSF